MVTRDELTDFLDDLLRPPPGLSDKSNNGLQVEGTPEVRRVIFGVDACLALFERAVAVSAQYVFVHHGISWGGGLRHLTGVTAARLRVLFRGDVSLYASHLPLDCHAEVGHNAEIARRMDLERTAPFFLYEGAPIGWWGRLPEPVGPEALAARVGSALGCEVRTYGQRPGLIARIGVVSGGAADAVEEARRLGLDALVTGEVEHAHVHLIKESNVIVLAAGHYRSECPGVEAVMARVADAFDVECLFGDLPTGL
ncbi:MAG: Nif3-like dinuclear metal center hexameric protein [Kiritimatiellaeota bacterium]|nr:Nif3-like dinuclear metal center hexameric protein [Kiritimatiellota bacterium]